MKRVKESDGSFTHNDVSNTKISSATHYRRRSWHGIEHENAPGPSSSTTAIDAPEGSQDCLSNSSYVSNHSDDNEEKFPLYHVDKTEETEVEYDTLDIAPDICILSPLSSPMKMEYDTLEIVPDVCIPSPVSQAIQPPATYSCCLTDSCADNSAGSDAEQVELAKAYMAEKTTPNKIAKKVTVSRKSKTSASKFSQTTRSLSYSAFTPQKLSVHSEISSDKESSIRPSSSQDPQHSHSSRAHVPLSAPLDSPFGQVFAGCDQSELVTVKHLIMFGDALVKMLSGTGAGAPPAKIKKPVARNKRIPEVPRSLNYREEENQFRSLIPISNPEQMIAMNTFIKLHNIPLLKYCTGMMTPSYENEWERFKAVYNSLFDPRALCKHYTYTGTSIKKSLALETTVREVNRLLCNATEDPQNWPQNEKIYTAKWLRNSQDQQTKKIRVALEAAGVVQKSKKTLADGLTKQSRLVGKRTLLQPDATQTKSVNAQIQRKQKYPNA